jgi:hypothetical protein
LNWVLAALTQVIPRYSTGHFTEYTLSTEDRLEIVDLCHKFDHILNQGNQHKLGELFAPDAQVRRVVDYCARGGDCGLLHTSGADKSS